MTQRPELHHPADRGGVRIVVPRQQTTRYDRATERPSEPNRVSTPRWLRRYAMITRLTDLTIIAAVVVIGVLTGLGGGAPADQARVFSGTVAGLLAFAGLAASRAWDQRVLGSGVEEFRRIFRAFTGSAVALGLGGLALHIQSVRVWVFALLPLAGLLCAIARKLLRVELHRERRDRRSMFGVLAVGTPESVAELAARTERDPGFGWRIVGACTPTGRGLDGSPVIGDVPVLGDLDAVTAIARAGGADVVAVAPAPGWGPGRLQRLAWDLEGTGVALAVDPGIMEIAGPRLHITPVDGMPLLQLSKPRFTGGVRLFKHAVDRVGATLLLLALAPVLVAVAVAVRRDGGPVFFRQERVGRNGATFRMVKFRSMCVDAEERLAALKAASDGSGPLFKMHDDPRVTRVGAVLRRYSIDELPQLLNVLGGSMSLVGPRPPLATEVAAYAPDALRRLLVKPGMTGLWQVSGRSDLTWEESVRLDLRYVENWSATMDASILWRTVGALTKGRGAY